MKSHTRTPRVVLINRRTPLEHLLDRYGTLGQVEFYLRSVGQDLESYVDAQERVVDGLRTAESMIPTDWRRTRVSREELDRFLFAPDDIVVVVGQDGLVPNVAKYLDGQRVVGVNPDPANFDGVLCLHSAKELGSILSWHAKQSDAYRIEARTMARARRDDGQELLALNELFIGHRSHQSARYTLRVGDDQERQSSSGLLCATGTGSTGWAKSIARQRGLVDLPGPGDPRLCWFVREPFPSIATGTRLDFGLLQSSESLRMTSEMGAGGVIFADGIEQDWVEFLEGERVEIGVADRRLHLVVSGPARQ